MIPPSEGVPAPDTLCNEYNEGFPSKFDFRRLGGRTTAALLTSSCRSLPWWHVGSASGSGTVKSCAVAPDGARNLLQLSRLELGRRGARRRHRCSSFRHIDSVDFSIDLRLSVLYISRNQGSPDNVIVLKAGCGSLTCFVLKPAANPSQDPIKYLGTAARPGRRGHVCPYAPPPKTVVNLYFLDVFRGPSKILSIYPYRYKTLSTHSPDSIDTGRYAFIGRMVFGILGFGILVRTQSQPAQGFLACVYLIMVICIYRKFKNKGRFRKPERPEDYITLHQTPGAKTSNYFTAKKNPYGSYSRM